MNSLVKEVRVLCYILKLAKDDWDLQLHVPSLHSDSKVR